MDDAHHLVAHIGHAVVGHQAQAADSASCQGLAILATQPRGADRSLRLVADYSIPNVSDKVVRIIHSYTDYVNRVVWKKY